MNRRFFLIALVFFLLIVNAALSQSLQASVFSGGEMLGLIPWWELKQSLPCGLFAAASFAIILALGAQFWRGLQPWFRIAARMPGKRLSQLTTAGMWCGWPLIACCTAAITLIFPWAADDAGSGAPFARTLLNIQLYGSVAAMVLVQCLYGFGSKWAGLCCSLLATLAALACGLMWWQGHACALLALALVAAPAGALTQPAKASGPQRSTWQRLSAALVLLVCAAACWFMLARQTVMQVNPQIEYTCHPAMVSAGICAASLLILAALAWLRCRPSAQSEQS